MIPRGVLTALAVLAYLGMLAHNVISLPQLPLLSADNLAPLVVYAGLIASYWAWPRSSVVAALLVSWTVVNVLVGGVLTVLPLPFLPFEPEQTPSHYVAHALYVAAGLPLTIAAMRLFRAS
ncbi:MAG: hypothetical protein WEE03_09090 [Chloroflexota bacterium]